MKSPLFVSLEGVDKTGKTLIQEILKTKRPETETTYVKDPPKLEPWDSIFHNGVEFDVPQMVESFLFLSARIDCYEKKIYPSLKDGIPVVADRYADSWIAYQSVFTEEKGYFQSLSGAIEFFKNIHDKCVEEKLLKNPDITILILIEEKELAKRLEGTKKKTKYERDLKKQLKVQEVYTKLSKDYSNRFHEVEDRGQGILDIYKEVESIISEFGFLKGYSHE